MRWIWGVLGLIALGIAGVVFFQLRGTSEQSKAQRLGLKTDFEDLSRQDSAKGAFVLYESLQLPDSTSLESVRSFLRTGVMSPGARQLLDVTDFAAIEQIAARERLAPSYDWDRPVNWTFLWLSPSSKAVSLLAARAVARSQTGDVSGCAQDVERAVSLIRQQGEIGFIFCYSLRARSLQDLAQALSLVCASRADDKKALAELRSAIGGLADVEKFDAIRHELAMGICAIDQIARGEMSIEDLSSGSNRPSGKYDAIEARLVQEHRDEIVAYYVNDFTSLLEHWGNYQALKSARDALDSRPFTTTDIVAVHARIISMILVPIIEGAFAAEAKNDAHIRGIRIGLAAYEGRARNGTWPTLAEAAAVAGVSASDPFGGELSYEVRNGQVFLYSKYMDGTDQGGNPQRPTRGAPYDLVLFGSYS